MTTDFPTAPSAYGLNGPSATVTVEKSIHASHTEILTPPALSNEANHLAHELVGAGLFKQLGKLHSVLGHRFIPQQRLRFTNTTLPEFSDDLPIATAVVALQGHHGKPNTFSS
jgi:hypothetical protein